jgi:hypothetical protein
MVAEIRRIPSLGDKPMCTSLRLFLIGTSLLLLAAIRCAQAGEIKIVSPSAYEHIEGEFSADESCCSPYRAQQVFPAADFAALGNQPHRLVDLTFRPDQRVTSPRNAYWPDHELRLSTTERGPDNLSTVFDDNLGSDVMQFYRGPLNQVTDGGAGLGPREFYDSNFPAGVTPYLYDPSQGNLLVDAIARRGVSPSPLGDLANILTVVGGSPDATGGSRWPALVYQFTFIPVTPGDYNASGAVEQADLDLVLLNWGNQLTDPAAAGWITHLPTGPVDQSELDTVLLNWGSSASTIATSTVPEPSAAVILLACVTGLVACRKYTRRKVAFNTLN